MRIHRQRYQTGSVRKVPRAHGFAWEFRYYYTDPDGQRKLKVQTFDAAIYKSERDVRKSVEAQLASLNANTLAGRAGVTFGQVIDRYLIEELPRLKHLGFPEAGGERFVNPILYAMQCCRTLVG